MSLTFEEIGMTGSVTGTLHRTQIPTGWLVYSGSDLCYVEDPNHIWALESPVVDPDPVVEPTPEPEPDPVVEPEPVEPDPIVDPEPDPVVEPEPVEPDPVVVEPTPEPEPVEVYEVVYDDALRNGWDTYSWASTDELDPDSFEGQFAISVDASNWSALNFFKEEGIDTRVFHGVEFAIKASTGNPKVNFSVNVNYSDLAYTTVNKLFVDDQLPGEYATIRLRFDEMGVPPNTVFTNILFKGGGGDQDTFYVDSVKLISFPAEIVPEPEPAPLPAPAPIATAEWLTVEGNQILSDGTVWQGRGANIFDTRSCSACYWNNPDIAEIKRRVDFCVDEMNVDFFRLCMEQVLSFDNSAQSGGVLDNPGYVADIKAIVDYCGTRGTKVLLSLWIEPTTNANDHPTAQTIEIWKILAEEFSNTPHVIFGCVNEPTANWDGSLNVSAHAAMQNTVNAIREVETAAGTPYHLIAVQGLASWGRTLTYYIDNPIVGDNIVYETHFYDPASKFNDQVVVPAQTLPVIVGEFGPIDDPNLGVTMTLADCEEVMTKCDEFNIPFLGWSFHMRCSPNMLVDNSNGGCGSGMALELTDWGLLVQSHLA